MTCAESRCKSALTRCTIHVAPCTIDLALCTIHFAQCNDPLRAVRRARRGRESDGEQCKLDACECERAGRRCTVECAHCTSAGCRCTSEECAFSVASSNVNDFEH